MQSKLSINIFLIAFFSLLLVPFANRGFAWPFIPFDMYCDTDVIHVEWLELKATAPTGESFYVPNYTLWRSQMPPDLKLALKGSMMRNPERISYLLDTLKRDYNARATKQADKLQAILLHLEYPSSRSSQPRVIGREVLGESN